MCYTNKIVLYCIRAHEFEKNNNNDLHGYILQYAMKKTKIVHFDFMVTLTQCV